jgi:hypothetical protein
LRIGDNIAIATTEYGKVQGFILNVIYQYRGIPYGANTSEQNRLMPPKKPEPLDTIYPALCWGKSALQIEDSTVFTPFNKFVNHWSTRDISEDCEVRVDTTVQEKNITFPTNLKLKGKVIEHCKWIARKEDIKLKRTYASEIRILKQQLRFAGKPKNMKKTHQDSEKASQDCIQNLSESG